MPAIISLRAEGNVYLLLTKDEDGAFIRSFHTVDEGKAYFEKNYRNAMEQGGGFATGATLHYVKFDPAVHEVLGDDGEFLFAAQIADRENFHLIILNFMGSTTLAAPLMGPGANAWHESGHQVKLVQEV